MSNILFRRGRSRVPMTEYERQFLAARERGGRRRLPSRFLQEGTTETPHSLEICRADPLELEDTTVSRSTLKMKTAPEEGETKQNESKISEGAAGRPPKEDNAPQPLSEKGLPPKASERVSKALSLPNPKHLHQSQTKRPPYLRGIISLGENILAYSIGSEKSRHGLCTHR